jgi:hypothetical protein
MRAQKIDATPWLPAGKAYIALHAELPHLFVSYPAYYWHLARRRENGLLAREAVRERATARSKRLFVHLPRIKAWALGEPVA